MVSAVRKANAPDPRHPWRNRVETEPFQDLDKDELDIFREIGLKRIRFLDRKTGELCLLDRFLDFEGTGMFRPLKEEAAIGLAVKGQYRDRLRNRRGADGNALPYPFDSKIYGDMDDPRGGVRGVIPDKRIY